MDKRIIIWYYYFRYISRDLFEEFKRLYPYPEVGDILISAVGSVGRTAEYTGADEYFQEVWDYPGKWYTMVATPKGAGSRKALIDTIVRDTLEHYRNTGTSSTDAAFYRLIAEYADIVCDYCLINAENRFAKAESVFPYRGVDSHRLALGCAARELFANGDEWSYDLKTARCKKLSSKALFAPICSDEWLNYRKAFL